MRAKRHCLRAQPKASGKNGKWKNQNISQRAFAAREGLWCVCVCTSAATQPSAPCITFQADLSLILTVFCRVMIITSSSFGFLKNLLLPVNSRHHLLGVVLLLLLLFTFYSVIYVTPWKLPKRKDKIKLHWPRPPSDPHGETEQESLRPDETRWWIFIAIYTFFSQAGGSIFKIRGWLGGGPQLN